MNFWTFMFGFVLLALIFAAMKFLLIALAVIIPCVVIYRVYKAKKTSKTN